ncbi:MAG: hypothetical protein AB1489_41845, partial [Acidobacteriota bacterium]
LSYNLIVKSTGLVNKTAINQQRSIKSIHRYDLIDKHIDNYLQHLQQKNRDAAINVLSEAELVANEMEIQTSERIGIDLVSYYRSTPITTAEMLIEARALRKEIESSIRLDLTSANLQKITQAKKIFEQLSAKCETERTNIQIIKYFSKNNRFTEALAIINNSLTTAVNAKHLFNQAQLLMWQGHCLSGMAKFDEAAKVLEESIRLGYQLDIPEAILGSFMVLAGIYYVTDNNAAAFEFARKALELARPINHPYTIRLLHITGLTALNLGHQTLAETCLQDAIKLAERQEDYISLAYSQIFLGILYNELGRTNDAKESFISALVNANKLTDILVRTDLETVITGYYARVAMLAGEIDHAIKLYTKALDLAAKANIQQNLMLSQLHQGLGESLARKGDYKRAKNELLTAVALDHKARKSLEENNSLLTFAASHKSSIEVLRTFPH